MKYEIVKIDQVKPNPKNPRTITSDKFQKLVKSIEDFPEMLQLRPLVVDEDFIILGGNMRYKACVKAGLKEIPIIKASQLTEEQKNQFIIKDNVGYGEWDWDQLANEWELDQLADWGMDIPEMETHVELEAEEDNYEIPEEIETTIKYGDLIEIGEHRLLCGDSTKKADIEKLMNGKTADMVCTDPPYNVDYTGGTKDKLKIMNDKMSDSAFFHFLLDFHTACLEHTKKGGAWYIWHADSEGLNFRRAFIESGLLLKQCLIWVKNSLVMGRQDYQWKHEPCLYGWRDGASHYFTDSRSETTVIDDKLDIKKLTKDEMKNLLIEILGDKTQSTILYHDKPHRNDLHPTMKPVTLMGRLIKNSSQVTELVLDPFLGSGSTMMASHQLKRTCYGLELDPKYCEVIIDRMVTFDPTLHVKVNGQTRNKEVEK
jgi:site-specific DNA-methyltransferase (adenine-specific)